LGIASIAGLSEALANVIADDVPRPAATHTVLERMVAARKLTEEQARGFGLAAAVYHLADEQPALASAIRAAQIARLGNRRGDLSARAGPRKRTLDREPPVYLSALVVIQICGAPFTPAFSIVAFNSADAAKALAFSALRKSCVTVTSFGLSTDR
jgi:hypothetical protein